MNAPVSLQALTLGFPRPANAQWPLDSPPAVSMKPGNCLPHVWGKPASLKIHPKGWKLKRIGLQVLHRPQPCFPCTEHTGMLMLFAMYPLPSSTLDLIGKETGVSLGHTKGSTLEKLIPLSRSSSVQSLEKRTPFQKCVCTFLPLVFPFHTSGNQGCNWSRW